MFELIWRPTALDELADIYVGRLTPPERDRVASQLAGFNRDLVRDAFEVGESRDDPMRVAIVGGLTVYFTAIAYTVRVIHVRLRD